MNSVGQRKVLNDAGEVESPFDKKWVDVQIG